MTVFLKNKDIEIKINDRIRCIAIKCGKNVIGIHYYERAFGSEFITSDGVNHTKFINRMIRISRVIPSHKTWYNSGKLHQLHRDDSDDVNRYMPFDLSLVDICMKYVYVNAIPIHQLPRNVQILFVYHENCGGYCKCQRCKLQAIRDLRAIRVERSYGTTIINCHLSDLLSGSIGAPD